MTQILNLTQGDVNEIFERLRRLENSTNQSSMGIGRGGITVSDGGVITIENGGLQVTGSAEIIGRLIASGTIDFTGQVNISGPLDVSGLVQLMSDLVVASGGKIKAGSIELSPDGSAKFGTMTISPAGKITSGSAEINPDGSAKFGQFTIASNGDLDSDGSLDINGPATLNNDLTVAAGKKIKLGGLTLENTGAGGGTVNFPNGSVSSSSTFGVLVASSIAVEIGAPVVKMNGLPTTSGVTPNVYIDGLGNLKRITP